MNDIERFKYTFRNALNGILIAFKTQRNLRIELTVGAIVLVLSALMRVSNSDFAILLLTILVVITAEVINTALEFTIDLVSPEFNQLAKKAKDVSAASVLIASVFAVVIGLVILSPKILAFLKLV